MHVARPLGKLGRWPVEPMQHRISNSLKPFCYDRRDMRWGKRHRNPLKFSSSARRDVRPWGMFIIGAAFIFAAYSADPKNCNSSGECAPWLLPIAFVMGALIGLSGLGMLMANPSRGSEIDPETGELVWWQNRYRTSGGDQGRIAPEQISLIRIDRRDEGSDQVHLYNLAGERQFYFDEEVIGWDPERWAAAMHERWPHIVVDVKA